MNIKNVRALLRSYLPRRSRPSGWVEVPAVGVNLVGGQRGGVVGSWAYDPARQPRFQRSGRSVRRPSPRKRAWPKSTGSARPARAPQLRLGQILVEMGAITVAQRDEGLVRQQRTRERIGEALVAVQALTESDVAAALSRQLDMPRVDLSRMDVDAAIAHLVPEHIALRHRVIPIALRNNVLTLAMADPLDVLAMDDVELMTGVSVTPVVATPMEVQRQYAETYGAMSMLDKVFGDLDEELSREPAEPPPPPDPDEREPLSKLVNLILANAVSSGASEIHLVSRPREFAVYYRKDGELLCEMTPPKRAQDAMLARLRMLAGLPPEASARVATGSMRLIIDTRPVRFTLIAVPTLAGERQLIKVHRTALPATPAELGFTPEQVPVVIDTLRRRAGLILITGLPGSGRSTTQHALFAALAHCGAVAAAVEPHLERSLPCVTQIDGRITPERSWADAVETCLAVGPSVALIGDIAEPRVATHALRFAAEGHLVLAALPSPDAVSAIELLVEQGVTPRLIAAAMTLVIAQRLEPVAPRGVRAIFTLVNPRDALAQLRSE